MTMSVKSTKCRRCKGDGEINPPGTLDYPIACPDCGGTGRAKSSVERKAHTALRSTGLVIRRDPNIVTPDEEKEANYFAMCLLMPEDLLNKEIKRMGGNFDIEDGKAIKRLADKFKVSVAVMTLRLGQISELRSAV